MKRKMIIASLAGASLIAAGSTAYLYGESAGATADADTSEQDRQGPPPAAVAIASAEQRSLAPRSEAPGSVVSVRDSLVASATSGKVEWVSNVGAEVEEGDVIARIENADASLALADSKAEVARLRARADYLDKNYERFSTLGDDIGESEASLDEMRSTRDEALQGVAQAEVALRRAQINLERTQVRAPFAGRVVSQDTQVGEFATPGSGIVRLVDTRQLEVTARAPASLVRNIAAGDVIKISNGAQSADATLRAVVPVGDERSRMLELRLDLAKSDWYIGSAVRVSLPATQARTVTAVPRDALILRADRISVFTITADNTAKQVDIELGVAEGDFIEVIGDIAPGASVVIRGGERLRDGQSVKVSTLSGEATV